MEGGFYFVNNTGRHMSSTAVIMPLKKIKR